MRKTKDSRTSWKVSFFGASYFFLIFGRDVCPGFQSKVGFPNLRVFWPARNKIIRFTSGATPALKMVRWISECKIMLGKCCHFFF